MTLYLFAKSHPILLTHDGSSDMTPASQELATLKPDPELVDVQWRRMDSALQGDPTARLLLLFLLPPVGFTFRLFWLNWLLLLRLLLFLLLLLLLSMALTTFMAAFTLIRANARRPNGEMGAGGGGGQFADAEDVPDTILYT